MSGSVRPIHPVPSFPRHRPIAGKQPGRHGSAYFFGPKSHRYLEWLAGKCALTSHFAEDRSEIILRQWFTEKQPFSSGERWLLMLGLYR